MTMDNIAMVNIEAEQAVLGGIILNPTLLDDLSTKLQAREFSRVSHQVLYDVLVSMHVASKELDLLTITNELQNKSKLEMVGGVGYLTELAGLIPAIANIDHYVDIVKDKWANRQLAEVAQKTSQIALNSQLSQSEKQQKVASLVDQLQAHQTTESIYSGRQVLEETVEDLFNEQPLDKLETGIHLLDHVSGGFLKGELVVIGGRSAMGKTAASISFLLNFLQDGKNIAYFTLEMSRQAMNKRMISAVGMIDGALFRATDKDGKLKLLKSPEACAQVAEAAGKIDAYPGDVYWIDTPQTVEDIRAKARKLKHTEGLDGIIIDYLELISATNPQYSRREQIDHIVMQLKLIAGELNIPVIVLAQINRGVESRQDKRPLMSDLKESGGIEQAADMVLLLYRDAYYHPPEQKQAGAEDLEIILGKHRNGATGMVKASYYGKYTKVINHIPNN
jgi:replicative DNA helicase